MGEKAKMGYCALQIATFAKNVSRFTSNSQLPQVGKFLGLGFISDNSPT